MSKTIKTWQERIEPSDHGLGIRGRDAAMLDEIAELREAIAAEEAQGVEPVAEVVPCYTPSGKRVALNTEYQSLPIGTKLFTRPAPPANTELLAGKLELMTAERDKLQLELGDLRALRARRPAHDNPTQIGGPGDWAIAGIEVKIGDGGPNFHLYRLLGSNELEPGVYELFARPAKPPAGERAAMVGRLRGLVDAARLRGPGCTPFLTCDDVDGIADMLTSAPQPQHGTCDSPELCKLNGECAGQHGTKQKCIAAPQSPQAERVPMTPEQISDTYQKATGQHLRPCDKHAVETLTREIEAHHKIGVKQ